jgi:hypothetical protein
MRILQDKEEAFGRKHLPVNKTGKRSAAWIAFLQLICESRRQPSFPA